MKLRSVISMLLVLCLLAGLSACAKAPAPAPSSAPAAEPAKKPETVEFTDDTGRTLTLPGEITKIAVTGPMSQIVLFSLAPDMLAGISNKWDPGAEDYFEAKYFNLPVLGQLYGGKGELNLEELLKAKPQLVLDVGEAKKGVGEDLDALSSQTGIPFVHIDAATGTMGEAYRKLGALLGLKDRAEELAAYCEDTWAMAEKIMADVGDRKVKLLYLLGDEGLNVIAAGSYHAEIIDFLGDNLAVLDDPSSKGTGNETDMEQLLLWDPEFIIFAHDSVAERVGSDPTWQQLKAIKEGKYAEVPYGPYNWMGFPPSVQRYLGILWIMKTIYPDQADYDLRAEVDRYFNLFYHCTLTDAQYASIVG